jgi:hypothetical protein
MRWLRLAFDSICRWLTRIFESRRSQDTPASSPNGSPSSQQTRAPSRKAFTLSFTPEHPTESEIQECVVYVVQYESIPKWAYLRCPCPKHDVIRLNLSKEKRPRWIVRAANGRADIHPSIWQQDGCFSHFYIRNGLVQWAKDSGRPPIRRV